MMMHSGDKPFECTKCEKAFSDKSNLNRHIWFIVVINPLSAPSVTIPSQVKVTLIVTWIYILEINPFSALSVERPSQGNGTWLDTCWYILEINPLIAPSVKRPSQSKVALIDTC